MSKLPDWWTGRDKEYLEKRQQMLAKTLYRRGITLDQARESDPRRWQSPEKSTRDKQLAYGDPLTTGASEFRSWCAWYANRLTDEGRRKHDMIAIDGIIDHLMAGGKIDIQKNPYAPSELIFIGGGHKVGIQDHQISYFMKKNGHSDYVDLVRAITADPDQMLALYQVGRSLAMERDDPYSYPKEKRKSSKTPVAWLERQVKEICTIGSEQLYL